MLIQPHQWFALQVRSRSEQFVAAALRYKGYEEFAPLLPSPGNPLPESLFPGYVFCRINPEVHGLIVTTPGVIRIVCFGAKPAPIDPEEIRSIQVSLSAGVYVSRYAGLHLGDKIRIETGPLRGVIGSITSIRGKNRLIIGVTTLMRSILLKVDSDWIKDITPLRPRTLPVDDAQAAVQPFRVYASDGGPMPIRDSERLERGAA